MSQQLIMGRLRKLLPCRGRKCDSHAVANLPNEPDGASNAESVADSWTTDAETSGSTLCRPLPSRSHQMRRQLRNAVVVEERSAGVHVRDDAFEGKQVLPESTESTRTLDDEVSMGTGGCISVASEKRIVLLTPKSMVQFSANSPRSPATTASDAAVAAGAATADTTECNGTEAEPEPQPEAEAEAEPEAELNQPDVTGETPVGDVAVNTDCSDSPAVDHRTNSRASMRMPSASTARTEAQINATNSGSPAELEHQLELGEAEQKPAQMDCQAEVCQLRSFSSNAADASVKSYGHDSTSEELVVSECLAQERLNGQVGQVQVVNNYALLNLHNQLNAELCEVSCRDSGSVSGYSSEAIRLSTNLSNVATSLNPSNLAASNQNASQQRLPTPLMMQIASAAEASAAATEYSGLSERRTAVNQSVTASAASDSTVANASELQLPPTAAASCRNGPDFPGGSGDARDAGSISQVIRCPNSCLTTSADSRVFVCDSDEPQAEAPDSRSMDSEKRSRSSGFLPSSESGRLGALSSTRCTKMYRALQSNVLMDRYMSKRDVSEATRIWHRQRCAYITADLVQKVLNNSVDDDAMSVTFADPAAVAAAAAEARNNSGNNSASCCATTLRPPSHTGAGVARLAAARRRPRARLAPSLVSIFKNCEYQ